MNEAALIYGKSALDRIVSIEVSDAEATIFRELEDGTLDKKVVSNQFWLLASQDPGGWIRLAGNLHYKWGRQFEKRSEFFSARKYYVRSGYDTYAIYDPKESFMVKDGYTYFKKMKVEDVSVLSFDIEATSLSPSDPGAMVLIISNTFRKNGKISRRMFTYDQYPSFHDMIEDWVTWVREVDPSVICGHNIESYDLSYLAILMDQHGYTLNLGRDGSPARFDSYESRFRKDQTQDLHYHKCRIYGREIVDTMFLAIKHDIVAKRYESYALKKIVEFEGWEVPGRIHYDASQIRFQYKIPEEWEKIKAYAMFDADDSLTLYDKMVPSQFYIAQSVPKSFQSVVESASGSQINALLVRSYLQDAHSIPKATDYQEFEGAISFGKPGIYTNCLSFDVASLYPSVMLEYEVYDKQKDPKGHFISMLSYFTQTRLTYKKLAKETGEKYYDDLQNSFKILANSFYGFMGAAGLNFNSPDRAAFVTEKGREVLSKAIEWASGRPATEFIFDRNNDHEEVSE